MKKKVQDHVKQHIISVLTSSANLKVSKDEKTIDNGIVDKHLKLLVRWYAQIDDNGKDSYDYKKKAPLQVMASFGMTNKLLGLFNEIYLFRHDPQNPKLLSLLIREYTAAKCEDLIIGLHNKLKCKNILRLKDFNDLLSSVVYYEHMTPSDVIVKMLRKLDISKTVNINKLIPDYYYVLMIKKEQQLKLDASKSGFKSKGTDSERLGYLKDRKISEIELRRFKKRLNNI